MNSSTSSDLDRAMPSAPTTSDCVSRRDFLWRSGNGCGLLALACLLRDESRLAASNPLAPRAVPFPGRARSVIWLHMHGAPSSIDLYDPKPELARRAGRSMDLGTNVGFFASTGTVMRSPFRFARHGQCGAWFSEVLPNLARHADDLAFLKGM